MKLGEGKSGPQKIKAKGSSRPERDWEREKGKRQQGEDPRQPKVGRKRG